jgi:hypothetical protein
MHLLADVPMHARCPKRQGAAIGHDFFGNPKDMKANGRDVALTACSVCLASGQESTIDFTFLRRAIFL